ncbi:hypothetical protein KIN20_000986 [Parelaphostrongylus tenuis]|uniref:Chondroitin proteoglycan 4 domain-containing protein n=1 Tax=Parelaphostrongylus tenuis TaxID=148309 RepID=A0AAD5ME44_PARTN|nr:hypothetical protein KIN20_000986 [Parelaphostrongylus tenuis]
MDLGSNLLPILCLFVGCAGNVVQLQSVDTHQSPLDDLEPNPVLEPNFGSHGSETIAELPSCHIACVSSKMKVFSIYFRSGTFKENMRWACDSYDEAVACLQRNTHCGTDSLFESLTSGLRYMCREQKNAFTALSDCIDANSGRVRNDCDHQCQPESLVAGIALKDTVMTQLEHPLVTQNVNMRQIIEPHMSRFFVDQGCRIGQCLMSCTRTKYNMLCEGTAGSLLMEMLIRPFSVNIVNSAAFSSTSQLASFLGSFLPHHCSFLTARDGSPDSYRIDSELDKEIKRMYRNRASAVSMQSSLSLPTEIEDPFLQMSNTFNRASPFDDPELGNRFSEDEDILRRSEVINEASLREKVSQTNRTIEGSGADSLQHHSDASRGTKVVMNDSRKFAPQTVEAGKVIKLHVSAKKSDVKALQANSSVSFERRNRE